ncbi:exodeoxyribonuclease VII large subunit [Teredinibacter sp. KSP-S5-2]|uniref:exodeoxyribonuclease VII large subunit n=1 Tax=Teredinibacter sp. KSP-S5-2 TaxID=3034506 RepID=UPI002934D1CE|nr:exodeoxyribonuclease VII large subunit [Teredinibacter sp. KSP-S5-2]WNO07601.1 exodeoxyribonuclease VII large subunit [Teredinibacter sp. KSP-S5-2]
MTDLFSPAFPQNNPERKVLSVSQLNRKAKQLLEMHLPMIWLEGEISNLSKPGSGHWYFTLKDENAQVRAAMFRGRNSLVKNPPNNGDKVLVRARVSIYEGRGDYQLIVEHMEDAGFGILQKRYEELKAKLATEGLFDQSHKKPLPQIPNHIGVITSPTGAAIRDVLSVLKRRFPLCPVTILPAPVQGDGAHEKLISALKYADESSQFDVILLCRGGGSIEDLWAFNSEDLARSIFDAHTPVVSAVGHEIDFTIADFVADHRAPTPSAAAELLSPDSDQLLIHIYNQEQTLRQQITDIISRHRQSLNLLSAKIKHPGNQIQQWMQKLDHLELKQLNAVSNTIAQRKNNVMQLDARLQRCSPANRIQLDKQKLSQISEKLFYLINQTLKQKKYGLTKAAESLDIVSPLSTLKRGYSIVKTEKNTVVKSASQLTKQQEIEIQFGQGKAKASVLEIDPT